MFNWHLLGFHLVCWKNTIETETSSICVCFANFCFVSLRCSKFCFVHSNSFWFPKFCSVCPKKQNRNWDRLFVFSFADFCFVLFGCPKFQFIHSISVVFLLAKSLIKSNSTHVLHTCNSILNRIFAEMTPYTKGAVFCCYVVLLKKWGIILSLPVTQLLQRTNSSECLISFSCTLAMKFWSKQTSIFFNLTFPANLWRFRIINQRAVGKREISLHFQK